MWSPHLIAEPVTLAVAERRARRRYRFLFRARGDPRIPTFALHRTSCVQNDANPSSYCITMSTRLLRPSAWGARRAWASISAGVARVSACAGRRVQQVGARSLFHHVGVDPVAEDTPVFDGRKVIDGSLKVRLDSVIDRHGVLVLGTCQMRPPPCLLPRVGGEVSWVA